MYRMYVSIYDRVPIRDNISSLASCSSTLSDCVTFRASLSYTTVVAVDHTYHPEYRLLGRLLQLARDDQLVQDLHACKDKVGSK